MRIAMIGQKGIPATHGGVERHVEELGAALADLGHAVTVFTRPQYTDPTLTTCRGMQLRSIGTVPTKHLDAITHSFLSTVASLRGFDVVHYHAIGPSLMAPLARLGGSAVVSTVHGQDWRRAKWSRAAQAILRAGEWSALHGAHVTISVSRTLAEEYCAAGERVAYIPNGVVVPDEEDRSVLEEWGIEAGRFILFAGRLVPEKGLHYLVEAYGALDPGLPLVVAGDSSHSSEYVSGIRANSPSGVIYVDYQYGARLAALMRNATLFVLPSDLEGLPIVLLEVLASGTPVLASDIAPNVEVLGVDGDYFRAGDVDSLRDQLHRLLADPGALQAKTREFQARILADYDWAKVATDTVRAYECALVKRRDPAHQCSACNVAATNSGADAGGLYG